MTDKELVLAVLRDRQPHSLAVIEASARAAGKERITVHSRVSDLRREGFDIRRIKGGYQLVGVLDPRQVAANDIERSRRLPDAVQGYTFDSVAEDGEISTHNGNICQIVRRASVTEASESEQMEYGPAFFVRFGDGKERVAYASELTPWYPT